jgi:hypothetical protein
MAADTETGTFERRRLMVIVIGIVVAWLIGGAATVLFLYTIPGVKVEISNREAEISVLQTEVKKGQATVAAIEKLKQKIIVVENLDRSRIRMNRILIRVGKVINAHDGTWLRQLAITKAKDPKRLRLNIHVYLAGATEAKMGETQSALMNAFEEHLVVMDSDRKPAENTFLGAKFERPAFLEGGSTAVTIPASPGRPARKLECRKFTIGLDYEPLPPLTSVQPLEKKEHFKLDTSAIKRDPFVCPLR